jgi:hypothetical protein
MPHRPPLTAAKLAELYDRNPSPEVLDLLWEIHRLRATVLRADQIRRVLRHCPAGVPNVLWEAFQHELDAEPCLSDPPTPRQQRIRAHFRARYEDSHQGSTAAPAETGLR